MTAEMDYATLTERAMNELQLRTEAAVGLYRLHERNWNVDQDLGTIVFDHPDGTRMSAPVQIIGTYNPGDGSWLWAWDHGSVLEPLRVHAETVRRYGAARSIEELTTAKLTCSEEACWRFTALASHLNGAQGAYRGPTGGPYVFFTYGTVTLTQLP